MQSGAHIPAVLHDDLEITQANELIRGKQDDLTLLEAKFIRLAIAQVLRDDTDFQTYTVSIGELARCLGMDQYNVYHDMKGFSKKLMRKIIEIKEPLTKDNQEADYQTFHWVDSVNYKQGTLTFRLSADLKPYLLGLDRLFTTYGLDAVLGLPTNYSIRLYELLASYQNITVREGYHMPHAGIDADPDEIVFDIGYIREYFGCTDKYPNAGDLVKRIIQPSVTAIQQETIMRVTYRLVKHKKKITHVVFKLHPYADIAYDALSNG